MGLCPLSQALLSVCLSSANTVLKHRRPSCRYALAGRPDAMRHQLRWGLPNPAAPSGKARLCFLATLRVHSVFSLSENGSSSRRPSCRYVLRAQIVLFVSADYSPIIKGLKCRPFAAIWSKIFLPRKNSKISAAFSVMSMSANCSGNRIIPA